MKLPKRKHCIHSAVYKLFDAPCVFCGYKGAGYYQSGTHDVLCPWYNIGGLVHRENNLRYVIAALFNESKND